MHLALLSFIQVSDDCFQAQSGWKIHACYVVDYVIPDSLNIFLRLLDPEDESEMITENDRFSQ